MRRHAIITHLGNKKSKVAITPDIQVRNHVPFLNTDLPAEQRITHERLFREMQKLGLQPTEIAMDLLVIAVTIFAADTRISREADSQDGWTREIDVYVPVS